MAEETEGGVEMDLDWRGDQSPEALAKASAQQSRNLLYFLRCRDAACCVRVVEPRRTANEAIQLYRTDCDP